MDIGGDEEIAAAYRAMVAQTRKVAGGYLRASLQGGRLADDEGMIVQPADYSALDPFDRTLRDALGRHVGAKRVRPVVNSGCRPNRQRPRARSPNREQAALRTSGAPADDRHCCSPSPTASAA